MCGKVFTTKYVLELHEKTHSKRVDKQTLDKIHLQCSKCHRIFQRETALEQHEAKCTGILAEKRRTYRYNCFECLRPFMTRLKCADHLAAVHKFHIKNPSKFCFKCKDEFEDILNHVKVHNCPYQCEICSLRFTNIITLDNHMYVKHKNGLEIHPFKCDQCPMSCKTSSQLQSHKASHATEDEKKFQCDLCSKRFSLRHFLTAHIKLSHIKKKTVACKLCNQSFDYLHTIKQHYIAVHGREFKYSCSECDQEMESYTKLRQHMLDVHGVTKCPQK